MHPVAMIPSSNEDATCKSKSNYFTFDDYDHSQGEADAATSVQMSTGVPLLPYMGSFDLALGTAQHIYMAFRADGSVTDASLAHN